MLRMIFNVFAAKYYEIAYIDKIDLNFAAILDNLLVAMVGIANAAHQYVPIAISITSAENTKSAVDILRWVRENSHARTKSVLADGAKHLTLAIQQVFGCNTTRLMCYFHMKM